MNNLHINSVISLQGHYRYFFYSLQFHSSSNQTVFSFFHGYFPTAVFSQPTAHNSFFQKPQLNKTHPKYQDSSGLIISPEDPNWSIVYLKDKFTYIPYIARILSRYVILCMLVCSASLFPPADTFISFLCLS